MLLIFNLPQASSTTLFLCKASWSVTTIQGAYPEQNSSFPALETCPQPQPEHRLVKKIQQAKGESHLQQFYCTSLTGYQPGVQVVFSLPFPALTAINSGLKGLSTEQISLSIIYTCSCGTIVPQRLSSHCVEHLPHTFLRVCGKQSQRTTAAVPTSPCSVVSSSQASEEEKKGTGSLHRI